MRKAIDMKFSENKFKFLAQEAIFVILLKYSLHFTKLAIINYKSMLHAENTEVLFSKLLRH